MGLGVQEELQVVSPLSLVGYAEPPSPPVSRSRGLPAGPHDSSQRDPSFEGQMEGKASATSPAVWQSQAAPPGQRPERL